MCLSDIRHICCSGNQVIPGSCFVYLANLVALPANTVRQDQGVVRPRTAIDTARGKLSQDALDIREGRPVFYAALHQANVV